MTQPLSAERLERMDACWISRSRGWYGNGEVRGRSTESAAPVWGPERAATWAAR